MVNQYQLLELIKDPTISLMMQEAPLFDDRWTKDKNGSGFSDSEQSLLANIPVYQGGGVSAVYKIHSPTQVGKSNVREIVFLVTELGLDERNFAPGLDIAAFVGAGSVVVTPSRWSKVRIVDYGFPAESVFVIPHGVDGNKFSPFSPEERQSARAALGYTEDDVVFLNVGAPIWNKGLDLVLQSYFTVRQTNKAVRLLIKDQQALYGLSAVQMIKNLSDSGVIAIDNDSVESIRVLPQTVSIGQLRTLYNVADYYLSPYRAEGFNLPVIEAIACGTPVIITDGGATDDFCNEYVCKKVPGKLIENSIVNNTKVGAYVQPDADALVQIMREAAATESRGSKKFAFGRVTMLEQFTWQQAARSIISLV
jgi:glycosyltransferase involved in cell wall biosynthesis